MVCGKKGDEKCFIDFAKHRLNGRLFHILWLLAFAIIIHLRLLQKSRAPLKIGAFL